MIAPTRATMTLFCSQCIELKNAPYLSKLCWSFRDKALSHGNVPLWKWWVILASACCIGPMHHNCICWYQAEIYSKEDTRGTWYGNHCAIQTPVQGYRKVANKGLVGATSRGDECWWLHRHVIMPCNVEQVVCAVHKAPYLGVGVK